MLLVLIGLGTWQLNRSSEKQALIESYEKAPELPELDIRDIKDDWQRYRYRKVVLRGEFDDVHQILLENQIYRGEAGYFVLTPFQLADREQVVLVNRGWSSRQDAQGSDMVISEENTFLRGIINHPPGVGIKMGSLDDSASGWPKKLPYVDLDWMALQLGKPVFPWIVLLDESAENGFIREWRPSVRMGPEKHKGYAFQWYSLAIALIFLFVVGSLKPEGASGEDKDIK